MRSRSPALVLCLLVAFTVSGCVTMRPYAEVAAALPPESLIEIDGRRVHVDDRGAGEPLLLLHGFGASTLLWEPVLDQLAADRRVVAIDLNGFGWSERPREPAAYTLEGQERTVLAVADALGFDRFDLAGHSYGGAISIFLTSRHPERVRSLILADSAMPSYAALRRNRRYGSKTMARLYIHTVGLTRKRVRKGLTEVYADDARVTDELIRGYLERLRVEGVVDAFHGLTAPNGEPPVEVDLGALEPPVLLVWGAEDTLVSAAAGRQVAERLRDATFVEIAGCGHSPMEECPGEFVAAVAPFLAERP